MSEVSRMERISFSEYLRELAPDKAQCGYAWYTAIGLQAVDGLKTSDYLIRTAIQNIEGEITIKEVQRLIQTYYDAKPLDFEDGERIEEADKVSSRIAAILLQKRFRFLPDQYLEIHKYLFEGIYPHAGKIRDCNISKKEWVLDGASVLYASALNLRAVMEYDLSQEREFDYSGLDMDETIHHFAIFLSNLWQIHPFGEGNTRTTAIFFIKYLQKLGFSVTNDIFAENAWYFRNALVRANYTNLQAGIYETTEYLERFLRNLLLNEKHELRNRHLHVRSGLKNHGIDSDELMKVDIEAPKVDIHSIEVDIETPKVDIAHAVKDSGVTFSAKTLLHIAHLRECLGQGEVFGKKEIMEFIGLKSSGASKLLSKLVEAGIIERTKGYGKGRYRFSTNNGE